MEPYDLSEIDHDGTRIMTVRGKEFRISAQSLPDDQWADKLQAKANLFGSYLDVVDH